MNQFFPSRWIKLWSDKIPNVNLHLAYIPIANNKEAELKFAGSQKIKSWILGLDKIW